MSDYPKCTLANLVRKTGDKGSYFVGFAGPMMITLSKLPEPDDQGREVWALKASNPPRKPKADEPRQQAQDRPRQADTSRRESEPVGDFDRRDVDIPF